MYFDCLEKDDFINLKASVDLLIANAIKQVEEELHRQNQIDGNISNFLARKFEINQQKNGREEKIAMALLLLRLMEKTPGAEDCVLHCQVRGFFIGENMKKII